MSMYTLTWINFGNMTNEKASYRMVNYIPYSMIRYNKI